MLVCAQCGVQITAANGRRQHHPNKHGERALRRTCRPCQLYQMRMLARLRKRLEPPALWTPCDCCGRVVHRLELDHDHRTGAHRGWCCGACNKGIGLLQDSLEGVLTAAAYLSRVQGAAEQI